MNSLELKLNLYEKMNEEHSKFCEWLLGLPKEEILNHTYEYSAREDILYFIGDSELSENEYKALIALPDTMNEIYKTYVSYDSPIYMEGIALAVTSTAKNLLKKEGEKDNEPN